MAKSARASSKKSSKAILRRDVFQPRDDERTKRLHDRLMATIASTTTAPETKSEMEVDAPAEPTKSILSDQPMDLDEEHASSAKKRGAKKWAKTSISRHKKPRNAIRFPPKPTGKSRSRR